MKYIEKTMHTCFIFALNSNKMTESPLEDLNILMHIFAFVGRNQYWFIASINHDFHNAYLQLFPDNKCTNCYNTFTSGHGKSYYCMEHSVFGSMMDQYILCQSAARRGSVIELQNLHSVRCQWDVRVCEVAAKNGSLHILQWVLANGSKQNGGWIWEWNEWVCAYAAENGHLHILKWAQENGCPDNDLTCAWAALGGLLHILQWARSQDFPWDTRTCTNAAVNGHLHVLLWARANGCPWNYHTCVNAALNGHVLMLQWAKENGCPWNGNLILQRLKHNGHHPEVYEWVQQNV
jgi:hypothetical protein